MEIKPEHEQAVIDAAHSSIGLYCQAWPDPDRPGEYKTRGPYEDGWNSFWFPEERATRSGKWSNTDSDRAEYDRGFAEATAKHEERAGQAIAWFRALPDGTRETVADLLDKEELWLHRSKGEFILSANCNDLFYWACSDSEDITLEDLPSFAAAITENPRWGSTYWCCKKRGMRPQVPIVKDMKEAGAWTAEMESLPAPAPS